MSGRVLEMWRRREGVPHLEYSNSGGLVWTTVLQGPVTAPSQVGGKGDEPAFPVPNDANVNGQSGLTIRQYYKAAALQGLCANSAHDANAEPLLSWLTCSSASDPQAHRMTWLPELAGKLADAMLAEDAAHASKQEHPNAR